MRAPEVFGVRFRNPVLLAAGTAGFGREVAGVIDLEALGGITTKAVSPEPRAGNAAPRVTEAPGAMLNSVGLANPGLEAVRSVHLPWLVEHHPQLRVVVNVVGHTVDDFLTVVRGLAGAPGITAFELNVSCPNTDRGGAEFGADDAVLTALVRGARDATVLPLVVKLSPTLADPGRTATVAAQAGADGFTCINTLPATAVPGLEGASARLGRGPGGLSGPALLSRGIAVTRAVRAATGKPVIGTGGIFRAGDARGYLDAGASLVSIGTAALVDPRVPEQIARALMEEADAAA